MNKITTPKKQYVGINMLVQAAEAMRDTHMARMNLRINRERIEITGRAGNITIEQGMLEHRPVTISTFRLNETAAYIIYGLTVKSVFEDAAELLF